MGCLILMIFQRVKSKPVDGINMPNASVTDSSYESAVLPPAQITQKEISANVDFPKNKGLKIQGMSQTPNLRQSVSQMNFKKGNMQGYVLLRNDHVSVS